MFFEPPRDWLDTIACITATLLVITLVAWLLFTLINTIRLYFVLLL